MWNVANHYLKQQGLQRNVDALPTGNYTLQSIIEHSTDSLNFK
jgi:hypothetical protein